MQPKAKVLFLLLHSLCNIACEYCFYTTHHERRDKNRIAPEQFEALVATIEALGFRIVKLTGGDPLHSVWKHETYALIAQLKARGIGVIINTSAALLEESDLDRIVALGVDRVDISIDSHDPAVHDAQRGRHADAVFTIKGLLARGFTRVATTTVVTKQNAATLPETLAWLRSLGVKDTRIQRVFLPGEVATAHDLIARSMREASHALPAAHAHRYIALTESTYSGKPKTAGASCRMGKEYFVCDATGGISPCFHLFDTKLGNLFTDPIPELLSRLEENELTHHEVPPCMGTHCTSLFDNQNFWEDPERKSHDALSCSTA